MLELTIDNKIYHAPSGWQDVKLSQYIRLSKLEIPEKLRALYLALTKDDELKEYESVLKTIRAKESIKEFPAFYGKVIEILTDIPKDVIDKVFPEKRTSFYGGYLQEYIFSLVYHFPMTFQDGKVVPYVNKKIEHFEFKGETYFLPESLAIFDQVIPMHKERTCAFAEVADLLVSITSMQEVGVGAFAEVCAILCRKNQEEYKEEIAIERAKEFNELPMDIVWEVFFCIYKLLNTSMYALKSSLKDQATIKSNEQVSEAVSTPSAGEV